MRSSVSDAFLAFTEPIEGRWPHLYLDSWGLVTIGTGCRLESVDEAVTLPFVLAGDPSAGASTRQIRDAYTAVQSRPDLAGRPGEFDGHTAVRLTEDGVDELAARRLAALEDRLIRTPEFAGFPRWPADAQLALLSLAWAHGPDFSGWPDLRADCAAGDWRAAADHGRIQGATQRNAADRALFRTAAHATENHWDPDVLWYRPLGHRAELRAQDSGAEVVLLQERLLVLGYLAEVTGVVGLETELALRGFQRAHVLREDGVAGPATWAALGTAVPATVAALA
ncbi:peptidoglycan-binding domain-containing protein [Catenuloplanes indicus]|uniref:GH24 family phage-related lysozyme (Muramidase) n=1 Tax=Catenuloplanes indicus TaxID=137267 RepID=A0AAE3VWE7_9ACTN|nr:peptidoglycan-binding domain-containing protein [Catenuloplanes indicus]MDQ0365458.1 GH24 family phage-related lysozyme (muramidase) [Catenuloplanes indicus]